MAECEICGVHLRTGRKYCWRHRNSVEYSHKPSNEGAMLVFCSASVLCFVMARYFYTLQEGQSVGLFIMIGLLLAGLSIMFGMRHWEELKAQRVNYNDSEKQMRRNASDNAIKKAFLPVFLVVCGFITAIFYFVTGSFNFINLGSIGTIFIIGLFITLFIVVQIGDNAKKNINN